MQLRTECKLCDSKIGNSVNEKINENDATYNYTKCPRCGEINLTSITNKKMSELELNARKVRHKALRSHKEKLVLSERDEYVNELIESHAERSIDG